MRRKSRIIQVVPIRTLEDSPEPLDRRLVMAYLQTNYRVPALGFHLRINVPDPVLDAWMTRAGFSEFAVLTAWNPGSKMHLESFNRTQNQLLEARLHATALLVLPALGIGDEGDWPPEESFFAAGIDPAKIVELAAEFDQNAIVFGKTGAPPELHWLL